MSGISMLLLLLVALGGAFGSVMRYLMSGWVQQLFKGVFPVGTLSVNVLGCLLIGFLSVALTGRFMIRDEYRIALLAGVLGGFTTFSSFGWETFQLAHSGQLFRAGCYVLLSNALGLAAVWIGYRAATGILEG